MKKVLILIVISLFVFMSCGTSNESVRMPIKYGGGSGTVSDPYLITTSVHLAKIINDEDYNSNFKLMNDIDLSNDPIFPLGTCTEGFEGVFDGNGFSLKNISYTQTDGNGCTAIFRYNGGTIKNLTIENIDISGNNSQVAGLVAINYGTIQNCNVSGTVGKNEDPYNGALVVGGICSSNLGIIDTVSFNGTVIGSDYVAGIVGLNKAGTISCLSAPSNVVILKGEGASYFGPGYINNGDVIDTIEIVPLCD